MSPAYESSLSGSASPERQALLLFVCGSTLRLIPISKRALKVLSLVRLIKHPFSRSSRALLMMVFMASYTSKNTGVG